MNIKNLQAVEIFFQTFASAEYWLRCQIEAIAR